MHNLLSLYRSVLFTRPVTTSTAMKQALALRYQVYCLERGYEDIACFEQGMESDRYDTHAMHFLAGHQASGDALGVARLVFEQPERLQSLPIEDHGSPGVALELAQVRARGDTLVAEVSRLAVTRRVALFGRQQAGLQSLSLNGDGAHMPLAMAPEATCRVGSHHIALGLLAMLCRQSMASGVTHWVALADTALLRLLRRFGIHSQPIGALIEHRGQRQPVMVVVSELWRGLQTMGRPLAELIRQLPAVGSAAGPAVGWGKRSPAQLGAGRAAASGQVAQGSEVRV